MSDLNTESQSNSNSEISFSSNDFIVGRVALSHKNILDDLSNYAYYDKNDLNIKKTFKNYMIALDESVKCMQNILDELTSEEFKSLKLECKGFNAVLYGDDDVIMRLYEKGYVMLETHNDSESETYTDDETDDETEDETDSENNYENNSHLDSENNSEIESEND